MLLRTTACVVTLVVGSAQAGTVLETLNRDLVNNQESTATSYAQDGRMRIESRGANEAFAIFRDETIYTFDPKQKTYIAMDRETMKRLADQLNPALKAIQEQLANMSPEQRAQMERMLGNKLPGSQKEVTEEVRKTTRTDKIAGHACTYSELLQDGVLNTEVCVAPAGTLKGSRELYDVAVKVGALVKDMMASVDSPWLKQMMDRQMEHLSQLGGLPVLTRTFDEGKPVHEATMKSIRTEALPATLFEIPPGYTARQLPGMSGPPQ